MKRSEIIGLIDMAGQLMDAFDGAEVKNRDTKESIGTIPEGDIRGMQTALAFCKHMLVGSYVPDNPITLASKMIAYHGALKFGLDADNCEDATTDNHDGSDAND